MNNYKALYLFDKTEGKIGPLEVSELQEATDGLKEVKNDENVVIWECEHYQVLAIKS